MEDDNKKQNNEPTLSEELDKEVEEYVKKVKKKLKSAQKDAKEYLDGWQRERADFVNYKKNIEGQIENTGRQVKADVLLQYLETIDNIELMAKHATDTITKTDWYKGVENAHAHAVRTLKNMDVEEIPAKEGDSFDPNVHEAVEGEGDTIEKILKKGYKMGDKILRPVQVKIKK